MPTASKERRKSEIIVEQKLEHAVATQTDRLLQGQVECGDLRASNHTAVNRFRKAANKVVVTNEVSDDQRFCSHASSLVSLLSQSLRQS